MHKHWKKVQLLSCAGINFPQEKTENTCIPKLQFRTTLKLKKIFFQRGQKKEKKRETLLKTQNHMYDWK